jgi:hypothetical protein
MTNAKDILKQMRENNISMEDLQKLSKIKYPLITTLYVHGDNESDFDHFRNLGFDGDEIIERHLHDLTYEIALTFEIPETGAPRLIMVDGKKVVS